MKPKLILVIAAVVIGVVGLVVIVTPDSVLDAIGMEAHGDGIIFGRNLGVLFVGLAVLDWAGRNAEGRGLRAILVGNLVVHLAELLLNGTEILTHQLPGAAWPAVSMYAAFLVLFGLALLATRERSRRRSDRIAAQQFGG